VPELLSDRSALSAQKSLAGGGGDGAVGGDGGADGGDGGADGGDGGAHITAGRSLTILSDVTNRDWSSVIRLSENAE